LEKEIEERRVLASGEASAGFWRLEADWSTGGRVQGGDSWREIVSTVKGNFFKKEPIGVGGLMEKEKATWGRWEGGGFLIFADEEH